MSTSRFLIGRAALARHYPVLLLRLGRHQILGISPVSRSPPSWFGSCFRLLTGLLGVHAALRVLTMRLESRV